MKTFVVWYRVLRVEDESLAVEARDEDEAEEKARLLLEGERDEFTRIEIDYVEEVV